MARLSPYPFAALIRRMFRELDRREAIFDLPARAFFTGESTLDLSVHVHGRRAATPFGPAAGPHTQLAQNIVLSWLAGGRAIELKTVQVNDRIHVPRPCIDVEAVGYNVEWSQELSIDEAIEEYVKAAMLIEMLVASGRLLMRRATAQAVFDLSVGYDLAGITSDRVRAFISTMTDASAVIDRLRRDIPDEYRTFRSLDFPARISGSVTLSTFHGCPPAEIERIVEFLIHVAGVDVTVKFNPTLLGRADTLRLLHECLHYYEVEVPDTAFDHDLRWDDAVPMMERLRRVAAEAGAGIGAKFTNTLVVKNHRDVFADQPEMYLSGPPLHVLAMHLVRRFRRRFGETVPISFSGGIDSTNFPDAVALGLVPVTVCTDLLKPRGYARAQAYFAHLRRRMEAVGASTIPAFVERAYPIERPGAASAAIANTEHYVAGLDRDPRYARERNAPARRKSARQVTFFDCRNCDVCIPVCPNDANFSFLLGRKGIRVVKAQPHASGWTVTRGDAVPIADTRQIGHFADFCNDCGNCDTFCPDDGSPYHFKPRFFRTRASWAAAPALDGFWLARRHGCEVIAARIDGHEYHAVIRGDVASFRGAGFALRFDPADPERTIRGTASALVDLTFFYLMDALRASTLSWSRVNYVNSVH